MFRVKLASLVVGPLLTSGCLLFGSDNGPTGPSSVSTPTATTTSTPTAPSVGPSDVLAYWPLNGNALDSASRWSGTIFGGVTPGSDRHGTVGGALTFDGNSGYIDAGQLHPPVNAFTVTFWMRPAVAVTTTGFNRENEIIGDAGNNRGFRLMQQDAALVFQAQGGGGSVSFGVTATDVNRWTHIAAVYDGRQVALYRDGRVAATQTSGVMTTGFQPLQIGRDPNVATSYWRGSLDEVRLYGRALSAAEIESLSR